MDVVNFWRPRCRHQIDKTAVDAGEPPQEAVIKGFLWNSPEKNGGSQHGEQDEDPESYPVVHLNEHAPAVGGHLPALGEVFSCEAHRVLSGRYRITCAVMCVIREETLKRVMKYVVPRVGKRQVITSDSVHIWPADIRPPSPAH